MIAIVQSASNDNGTGSGAVTVTMSVAAGNAALVFCFIYANTTGSNEVSDNKGDTFARLVAQNNGSNLACQSIYLCSNLAGGSTTFSYNESGYNDICVVEVSGLSGTTDGSASQTVATGTIQSGNIVTANANDLIVACASDDSSVTWTHGTGYTMAKQQNSAAVAQSWAVEYQIASAAGTFNPNFGGITGNSIPCSAVAIKAAPGGPTLDAYPFGQNSRRFVFDNDIQDTSVFGRVRRAGRRWVRSRGGILVPAMN